MKTTSRFVVAGLLTLANLGCFHQIVDSGRTPGPVVERQTATTWIFGLVEAEEIDVRTICPAGVALVETKQTFINGLLGALTLGIYTPQTVIVTCAATGAANVRQEINLPETATAEQVALGFESAIRESMVTGQAVALRF